MLIRKSRAVKIHSLAFLAELIAFAFGYAHDFEALGSGNLTKYTFSTTELATRSSNLSDLVAEI